MFFIFRTCISRYCGLRHGSAAIRLLELWVWILPGLWMFVSYECFVFSVRGLCVGLITHPEEPYQVWCVCGCEASIMRNPWPIRGCHAMGQEDSKYKVNREKKSCDCQVFMSIMFKILYMILISWITVSLNCLSRLAKIKAAKSRFGPRGEKNSSLCDFMCVYVVTNVLEEHSGPVFTGSWKVEVVCPDWNLSTHQSDYMIP
jgi:hypothetical protein